MDFETAIDALCRRVEGMAPGSAAGVTLCDAGYTHIEKAVFPTLAPSFAKAIVGVPLVPSSFGSCVKAIETGLPITSEDIENDINFDPRWKRCCLEHGLRSIQSRPIFRDGKAIGTFVLAYREPRGESDWNIALMKFGADGCEAVLASALEAVLPPVLSADR